MPSPPSGSEYLTEVGATSLWYLTTDTGGAYDTKIYTANGTLIADIANADAAGAIGFLDLTPQLFYVDFAGSTQRAAIYATDGTAGGTSVVMTVGTAGAFATVGSSEVFEVTTSAPASETLGGALYHYTLYTSTLYSTDGMPRSPQVIAQITYGTPFDETDGGFTSFGPPGELFTATGSSVASETQNGTVSYYTALDTDLYRTDGTPAGTQPVLQNITSATAIGGVGYPARALVNVIDGGDTYLYSVNPSDGSDPQLVLTLDGVYSANLEIDFRGNQFLGETNGTTFDFYETDGTAAGTQLLLSTMANADEFYGNSLGFYSLPLTDFFVFSNATTQQLYETQLSPATTQLVATAPSSYYFEVATQNSTLGPPTEDVMIVVVEYTSSNNVAQVFWINGFDDAVAVAGDEDLWVGPLSGDWNDAANWQDTTLGTDPAAVAPGSSDSATIADPGAPHANSDQFQTVGGTGESAYLTFEGDNTVTGKLTTGVLWVSGYVGELQIDQGGSISAGFGLFDVSVAIDLGALSISNSLTIQDVYGYESYVQTVVAVTGGQLDVGGELSVGTVLYAVDHSQVQAGTLAVGGEVFVDATSSIEVGDAGGALLGALTVDAGATLSVTASSIPLLGIGNIIDNGTISFPYPGIYPDSPVLLNGTANLSGHGQVVVGSNVDAVIGAPVLDGSLTFQVGNNGTLTLNAVGVGNTIMLTGDGVVALDGQATYDPSTQRDVLAYDMDAVISGLDASDTITIDTAITRATYTAGSAAGTGTLALTEGTTLVATINLDGAYASDTFVVTPTSPSTSSVRVVTSLFAVVAPTTAGLISGQATPIAGLGLEDGSVTAGRFSVTLSGFYSVLTANGTGVLLTGSGTDSLTISGQLAQVNAALATVRDSLPYIGETVTLAASDPDGNTATTAVNVSPIEAPVVQTPVSATVVRGQAVAISGVSIAESNATAGESFTVTVTDQRGLLATTGAGVTGSGTVTGLTITGTLAQVNAALATLTDTAHDGAPDKIQVFVTDSYGNHAHAGQIAVGVNGTPMIAVPAAATVGVGQATKIAGIVLSETGNTTGERFTVTLTDSAGLLTVGGGGGSAVTGSGTTSLTLSGALPQVNAALATLLATEPGTASDAITVTASDSYGDSAAPASIAVAISGVTAPASTASIRATALHLGGVADPAWGSGEGGVTVSLLNGGGTVIATAVTTGAGQATFGNLAAGPYRLQYTAPAGQGFEPGGPDSASGVTASFTVAAGQGLIGPSGDLMTTRALNGTGLNVTPAPGAYLVTGDATDSTLTLGNGNDFITLAGNDNAVTTGNGNETITLSGLGNSVTTGVGNIVINTGGGGATVQAMGGDVTITAAGGNNWLDGGSGLSFLNADGSAGNVFVLAAAGTPTVNMTTVTGFNAAAGDVLDLHNTLADSQFELGYTNLGNFITAAAVGGNTVLLTDTTSEFGPPVAFATLVGTHVSVAQLQALNAFSIT